MTSSDPGQEIRSMIAAVRRRWLRRVRLSAAAVALSALALPIAVAVAAGLIFGVAVRRSRPC